MDTRQRHTSTGTSGRSRLGAGLRSRLGSRFGMGAAAGVLVAAGFAVGTASAHTAPISATCDGLHVELTDYSAGGINTVRVWIDGAEKATISFGESTSTNYGFGDATVAHTWRVSVTAWDDPAGARGWTFDTGTRTIDVCATPTTAPATTAPATTAPATTSPVATTAPATTGTAPTTTAPASTTTAATVASAVVSSPSTTALVAQAGPTSVVAAPTSSVASLGQLPVTGGDAPWRGTATALIALGFGVLLVVATRRPGEA